MDGPCPLRTIRYNAPRDLRNIYRRDPGGPHSDRRWRERRHPQWTENYQLYRDTIITNRLTQRQNVNVPFMKETIRTLLSRASEPADLTFEDYENNGVRELLMNAH